MSGLDPTREVDVDVTGVDRLRLIVMDAGDWCEPVLVR